MAYVAPLTGSVDRNFALCFQLRDAVLSLPSRGAWIEICSWAALLRPYSVAPLTGSVDRNKFQHRANPLCFVAPLTGSVDRNVWSKDPKKARPLSLPSRGAWIEIGLGSILGIGGAVAPLTGSVDRNLIGIARPMRRSSRSPHGERG